MSWFSWFRKKKKQQSGKLRIHFEYSPEAPIHCFVDWPVGYGKEIDDAIVQDFSQLLAIIHTGNALSMTQQAVALAGKELNAPDTARRILHQANILIEKVNTIKAPPRATSDDPIIPADLCFPSRRNRGELSEDD